jgi:hypothetical protein
MIKQIFSVLAGLAFAMPASATSWQDVHSLVELVEQTGTTVSIQNCTQEGVMGYYSYDPQNSIDVMAICKNAVDMQDADAVWEVVSHEATHVMQACQAGPVIADSKVPRVLRELQEMAPHYYATLQGYRGDHKRLELEAFWMELRSASHVMDWMVTYCFQE